MEELKKLVEELEQENNEERIIELLQKIGEKLVNNYVIRVPNKVTNKVTDIIEIQPLWVEAYYSNIGKKFIDPFIHGADEQKDAENFGKLYFHHKTDDQRSGVDICLTCGKYYLSFLLKYTLVNGIFTTQSQLSGKIRESYNKLSEKEKSKILIRVENATEYVTNTKRKGLVTKNEKDPVKKEQKERYQKFDLAIVRDFHKTFTAAPSLPRKEILVKQYLDQSNETMAEKAKFCIDYLGYCPKEYKEK